MIIQILLDNPLLLLFSTAGIGYFIGRIKIGGSSLGVAAVLFVGLGFGAIHPDLKLPEIVYLLGLVLFVYTIGLSSGPLFFRSFRGNGLRDNLFTVGIIVAAALILAGLHDVFGLTAAVTAGVFAGSLTNTPALAGVLEYLATNTPPALRDQRVAEPVIAYSLAYPVSVLVMILVIYGMQRWWKINYATEAQASPSTDAGTQHLEHRTIRITQTPALDLPVAALVRTHNWQIVFGRIKRGDQLTLVQEAMHFALGDIVTAIGTPAELQRVGDFLGETSNEQIALDRSEIDYRRILVSNPKVVGLQLKTLNLPQQFGAVITRVRRGDVELLPRGTTTLQPGDRVRVVTRRENLDAVSAFLGDSYRTVSEIDILSFSLGITLGVLLGMLPLPLPGGITIKLGLAGGPLVVALVLGFLGRTGPIVWNMPYSANLVLRQIGLICFLAGVGTRAGYAFLTTLRDGNGWLVIGISAFLAAGTAFSTLWIGYRLLKIPMGTLIGILAGIQTQPATLGFALEQTANELPNIAYATSFPIAVITKIILAQLLVILLA